MLPTVLKIFLLFALKHKYVYIVLVEAVWTGKIMCSFLSFKFESLKILFLVLRFKIFLKIGVLKRCHDCGCRTGCGGFNGCVCMA